MTNYKPKHGDMELWLICAAIKGDNDKILKMAKSEKDGTYPVKFEVGGIELDFSVVAKRIEDSIDELVASKAQEFLDDKYENLIKGISDIQERIYDQKEKFFKCKGICIGCDDKDIDKLKFPLKLVSASYNRAYEECEGRSYRDPEQGFVKTYWGKDE